LLWVGLAWDAGLLLLAVYDAARSFRGPGLSIDRIAGRTLSLGGANRLGWQVENRSLWPAALVLRDDLPVEFEVSRRRVPVRVPAGGEAVAWYHARPERRGQYVLGDVHGRRLSRWGLVVHQFRVERSDEVRVYPNLMDVARYHLLARQHRRQQFGLTPTALAGEGSELESLRPYRPGDRPQRIHWKATARRYEPVSKDYQLERSQNVLLVLDAGRLMSVRLNGLSRLDYSINAALMLAHVALRQGDRVGLLAFAGEIQAYVPPRGGRGTFQSVLDALYNLEATLSQPDYDRACRYLALRNRRRSLLLVFTEMPDRESCEPLPSYLARFARRHVAVTVSLTDPAVIAAADQPVTGVHPAYSRAVAAQLLTERSLALHALRRQGVTVLDSRPDQLTPEVVNEYLRLKFRSRL
jgi:uncharacterized protein (DUF58 family)